MHPDETSVPKKKGGQRSGFQDDSEGKDKDGNVQPRQEQRCRHENKKTGRIADEHGVEEIAGLALVLHAAARAMGVHAEE